jgi:hypothetical protein
MGLYQFRLPVRLPPNDFINSDTDSIQFPCKREDRALALRIANYVNNKHSSRLFLAGYDYRSPDEAKRSADAARVSLMAAFALNGMGLEVPANVQVYAAPNQPDGNVRQDGADSLIIFPQESRLTAPSVEITAGGSAPNQKRFRDSLTWAFSAPLPSAQVQAALELYMAVHFQTTIRAKYFQLMTVIESLSNQEPLSADILEVYAKCGSVAEESLSEPERNEWLSRLGHLKYESIAASCTRLILEQLGPDDAAESRRLYALRSSMLHGDTEHVMELRDGYRTLSRICYWLIAGLIAPE